LKSDAFHGSSERTRIKAIVETPTERGDRSSNRKHKRKKRTIRR